MSKEHCENFKKGCKKLSIDRMGEKNPMYGHTPWNKGVGLEDERIEKAAQKRRGSKTPEYVKKKQSDSAKKRTIHGHTGKKQSQETIE